MKISYQEFVKEVFDHPVTQPAWYWNEDNILEKLDSADDFLAHATTMFQDFGIIGPKFRMGQINHGLWMLFHCSLETSLTDCMVDLYSHSTKNANLETRLAAIKSIYHVYADFVVEPQTEVLETCFDMWWDVMCDDFWKACEKSRNLAKDAQELDYIDLSDNERSILDTMLDTLLRILHLDDENCKEYALHGIGHSRHPKRAAIVQAIIDSIGTTNSGHWTIEYLPWLESCRDGTVL